MLLSVIITLLCSHLVFLQNIHTLKAYFKYTFIYLNILSYIVSLFYIVGLSKNYTLFDTYICNIPYLHVYITAVLPFLSFVDFLLFNTLRYRPTVETLETSAEQAWSRHIVKMGKTSPLHSTQSCIRPCL